MLKKTFIASVLAFACAATSDVFLGDASKKPLRSEGCEQCSAPDNCFHPTWASPCSCASDKAACEASSSGATWCPGGPTPPPGPTGDAFVGGYIGLYAEKGLDKLKALADNASTIPLTRLWLAFVSPMMVYRPGTNKLTKYVGFDIKGAGEDGGFKEVADAVRFVPLVRGISK